MANSEPSQFSTPTVATGRSKIRATLAAWLFLALVTCVFFREPIFEGKVFYVGDHAAIYVPMHSNNARLRAQGEIPLWNRHGVLGYPSQAENELSGVYPPSLIFNLVTNPGTAYTLFVLFHYFVGLAATMYLTRVVGAGIVGQTIAALVFVFGGSFTSFAYTFTLLGAFAWAPLILGLQLRSFESKRYWPAALAGIAFAVQTSGAHFHASFFTLLLMMLALLHEARGRDWWAYLYSTSKSMFGRRHDPRNSPPLGPNISFALKATFVVLAVGLGLCAPQLGYSLDLLLSSSRGAGLSYEQQVTDSLPPHFLFQLLVPNFLGEGHLLYLRFCEMRIYCGLLALSLGVLGWLVSKPFVPLFRTLFVASVVLACGKFLGVYILVAQLPGFRQTHLPDRFLLMASLAAAVLTGLGTDRLLQDECIGERLRKWFVRSYALIAAMTLSLGLLAWSSGFDGPAVTAYQKVVNLGLDFTWPEAHNAARLSTFVKSSLTASCLAVFCAGFWLLLGRFRRSSFAVAAVGGVLAVDLLIANGSVNDFGPKDYYTRVPPTIEWLRSDETLWRVWAPTTDWNVAFAEPKPLHIVSNSAALFNIDSMNSLMAAGPDELMYLLSLVDASPMGIFRMGVFNVKYLLSHEDIESLARYERFRDGQWRVYENPYYQPRVSVREQFRVASDQWAVWSFMNSDEYSIAKDVTVNETPRFLEGELVDQPPADPTVTVRHYAPRRVAIDAVLPRPGILVLNDLNYRGWRATSNGRPVKILVANGLVRGLALGPGRHEVEFIYRPKSFYRGLYISAAVLLVLLGWVVVQGWSVFKTGRGG